MTASIFPDTFGDVILKFTYRKSTDSAAAVRPALVQVDKDGKELGPFGLVLEVRDGGGHLELFRFPINTGTFDTVPIPDSPNKIKIHPEGV